jgi:periplasmic protein TonB
MSSLWPSALASLDDHLALFSGSLGKLEAAQPVDVTEVIEQLELAAESSRNLCALVLSEVPEASWESRQELDALIEEEIQKNLKARALEQLRSRLLALATELERGSIVHRRVLRVNQLNDLRDQAVKELRSQAGRKGAPQPLPGPEADLWIEWACGLKEPEDTESLQALRNGFTHLDDFIAGLEPGMWTVKTLPSASWENREELDALIAEEIQKGKAKAVQQLHSRLLALATELERGSIVHHRAFRVSQLNQLRDQAIEELRSLAGVEGAPPILPGPEADHWVEWACALQEPEDAESLQTLRNGFAKLDDFVANLELDMWRAAGSSTLEVPPGPESSADKTHQEQFRLETNGFEEPLTSSGPIPIKLKAAKSSGGRAEPRVPPSYDEPSVSAHESNTLPPNYVAPQRAREEVQPTPAQRRAPQTSITGATDQVRQFSQPVEPPFVTEVLPEASAATAITEHPAVKPPFTTEVFPETSATSAFTTRPVQPHFTPKVFRVTSAEPAFTKRAVEPPVTEEAVSETSAEPELASHIGTRVGEFWEQKRWMLLTAAAVLVLAVLGAILWRSHRKHTGNGPVVAVETKAPDLTSGNPQNKGYDQPGISTDLGVHAPTLPKDQSVAPQPPPPTTAPPEKQVSNLDNGPLRTPQAIPKNTVVARTEEAPPNGATGVPGSVPGGSPSVVPNSVTNIVRSTPVAKPAAPKVRVSSGVAQGQLIYQVPPVYPVPARQANIQGTVVLQAVIGKDGTVKNVKALHGHSMLRQAAVNAVKQWRYKPFLLNGEPTEAEIQINVNFTP